jgi:hypothetical protein
MLNTETDGPPRLFTHSRRPQWGVGILTSEADGKRNIRFQDGKLRTFKEEFFHFLDEFDASDAVIETMAEELIATHDAHNQVERRRKQAAEQPPVMSFDEQVRVFEHLFPGGFQGDTWLDESRRPMDEQGFRKRHVDAALEKAQEILGKEALEGKLSEEIIAATVEVLTLTKLASPSKLVRPFQDAAEANTEALGNAILALLHGEESYDDRMRAFVMALDAAGIGNVTWPMVTLLPSLVHPAEHVAVNHRPFALQARSLDPNSAVPKAPSPIGYNRFQALAHTVRDRLIDRGHKPADLMDIRGFIWETLRPRGVQALDEVKL